MNEGRHEASDGPSRDELRELLGEVLGGIEEELNTDAGSGENSYPAGGGDSRPVLLVSRRSDDLRIVEEGLGAQGRRVDKVVNAFAALDKLRTSTYSAVVSDLDLWANNGSLLLERVEGLDAPIPVLFLVERGPTGEPKDLGFPVGAPFFIHCPLDTREFEEKLSELWSVEASDPSSAADTAPALESPTPAPVGGHDEPEEVPEEALPRDDMPGGDILPGDSAESGAVASEVSLPGPIRSAELGWLRWLVLGQRQLRDPSATAAGLARLAIDELGALATGFFCSKGDRTTASLESQAGTDHLLFRYVLDAQRGRLDEAKAMTIHGENACLVLIGLTPVIRDAGAEFVDDVRELLVAWQNSDKPA